MLPFLALLTARVGIVGDGLVVDFGQVDVSPLGLFQCLPVAEGTQTKLEHPVGLFLLLRNQSDDIFVESFGNNLGVDLCGEAVFVFLFRNAADQLVLFTHDFLL